MKRILTYGLLTLAVVLIGLGAWLYLAPAYADRTRLSEDVVTRYHDLMLVPGVRGAIIARMEQLVLEDPVPLLKSIKAPTLLVWGAKDAMIPLSNDTAEQCCRLSTGASRQRVGYAPESRPRAARRRPGAVAGACARVPR